MVMPEWWKDYNEQRKIALQTNCEMATIVYDHSRQLNNPHMHLQPITNILTWTQQHLEAYLATTEVLLEQNIDPG